jgi:hypothetical protein
MTIYELADLLSVELIVTRYQNQDGRWSAHFERCEVAEGSCLVSAYGDGKTPEEAIQNYCQKIAGQRLVFNAMNKYRREFVAPKGLEL